MLSSSNFQINTFSNWAFFKLNTVFKELLTIGGYAQLLSQDGQPFFKKLLLVLAMYGLVFASLIVISPLMMSADWFVAHVLHAKGIYHSSDVLEKTIKRIGLKPAIVYICLLGPFFEEVIFRLPLSLKKIHIVLSVSLISLLVGGFVLVGMHVTDYKIIKLLIFFVITFALGMWLVPDGLSAGHFRFKKVFIIVSMCLFGLMHIVNYSPLQWKVIWIYPVFILPQFLMGWAITYVRFKNGFFWGVLLHVIVNSVSVSLAMAMHKI